MQCLHAPRRELQPIPKSPPVQVEQHERTLLAFRNAKAKRQHCASPYSSIVWRSRIMAVDRDLSASSSPKSAKRPRDANKLQQAHRKYSTALDLQVLLSVLLAYTCI